MRIRLLSVLLALSASACAGTTPPPRFSALDPADPGAPEASAEPRAKLLELPAARSANPAPPAEPTPMGHEHHLEAPASQAPPAAEVYSCLMHPQIKETKPGKCPICGMTLVKQAAEGPKEHQP